MSRWPQHLFFVILIGVFSMVGCGGSGTATHAPVTVTVPDPAQTYQIIAISDLHFNPLYDPSLFNNLVSAMQGYSFMWPSFFQSSVVTTPSAAGTDTNYPLLQLTLASIQQNAGNSPVVLFTGDALGHNIPTNYCIDYLTGQNTAVNSTNIANCITSQASNIRYFIDTTFAFLAGQIRAAVGNVPVIYVPGNIDTYTGSAGPNTAFLKNSKSTVYTDFLNSLGDSGTFTTNFEAGGYYSVEPLGQNLLVIVLNSNSFLQGSPALSNAPNDATAELTWLNGQLQAAQTAGQKVWILMHVPPGVNSQSLAQLAAVPSEVDEGNAAMMWNLTTVNPPPANPTPLSPTLQETFIDTLSKYPGVVTMMLAGHTHMDEFRILSSAGTPGTQVGVLEQLPGISPCFGNNPAYKLITVTQDTFTPTDYQSVYYDLATMPAQFGTLYQFSTTYGFSGQSNLTSSLESLNKQLNSTQSAQDTYSLLYTSGSTAVNPVTYFPWNPINDVNWPIFGCTIGDSGQSDYLTCVNP